MHLPALLLALLLATTTFAQLVGLDPPYEGPGDTTGGLPFTGGDGVPPPPPPAPEGSDNPSDGNSAGGDPPASSSSGSDSGSTPQFVRLRDVQLEGESLGGCFERLSPKLYLSEEAPEPAIPKRRLLVANEVQRRIDRWSELSSQQSIPNIDSVVKTAVGKSAGETCNFDSMNYSSPTHEFLHVDQSFAEIYPGAVLKSSFLKGVLDGSESPVPVPASAYLKNPKVKILDQLNVNTLTEDYEMAAISRKISGAIGLAMPQNKDLTIYYEMGTTDDLADFANRLGFNGALLRKLGLARQGGPLLTAYRKKFIFVFTKPIGTFSAKVVSPNDYLPNTPLNAFFSPALTLAEFDSHPSWWGPANPPVFIDSVTYGSLIVLTVDYSLATRKLYETLPEAALAGPAAVQEVVNSMLRQSSLKVFSRGPFSSLEIKAIKESNWSDFMLKLPNNIGNMVIQPLLYRVKDFGEQRFSVANRFEYVRVCASELQPVSHKIQIQLDYVLNYAPVKLIVKTPAGQVVLSLLVHCPTTYDLTDYLNQPNMLVVVRPTVSCSCPFRWSPNRQQVKAGFVVDGAYSHKLQVSCSGKCVEYDAGVFTVDKATGTVTP